MWKATSTSRIPLLESAIAASLALGTLLCAPPFALAQDVLGEVRALEMPSAVPYSNSSDREQVAWSQEIRHPGALFVKLHFSRIAIGPSDYITVSDPLHRRMQVYGSADIADLSGPDGLWALSIFGESALVELHAAPGSSGEGVEIDSYGFSDGISPLSICGGQKNFLDMICLNDGVAPDDPNRYNLGRPVALWLNVKPTGTPSDPKQMHLCTAFLVSPKNLMLSAGHCVGESGQDKTTLCNHSEFWFGYEDSQCDPNDDNPLAANVQVFRCGGILDWQLGPDPNGQDWDWTILQLDPDPVTGDDPATKFGWLDVKQADPDSGASLFIIQHPGAQLSPGEPLPVKRYAEGPAGVLASKTSFRHKVDTRGGSSGSPVFDAANKSVVGIHVRGGCDLPDKQANEAQRVTAIWPVLESWLNKQAPISTSDLGIVSACVTDPAKSCVSTVYRKNPWHVQFTVYNKGAKRVDFWTHDVVLVHQETGEYVPLKMKEPGQPIEVGQSIPINQLSDFEFPDQSHKGPWEAKITVRILDKSNPDAHPQNNTMSVKFLVENEPAVTDLEIVSVCTTDELKKACTRTVYTNQPWHILFIAGNNGGKPIPSWNFDIQLLDPTGNVLPLKQQVPGPPLEVGKKEAINWQGPILDSSAKGPWTVVVTGTVKDPTNPDARPGNNQAIWNFGVMNKSDLISDIGLTGACVTIVSPAATGCRAFFDADDFRIYNEQHGKAMKGVETFEEAVLQQGLKECFPAPIGPLPSPAFPNGLEQRNLHIQDNVTPGPSPPSLNPSKNDCALYVIGPGFIGSNSMKVGEDIFLKGLHASLDLIFNEPNHTGVGFKLSRFQGFPSAGWIVTAYNKGDQVIGSFKVPPPTGNEPIKEFFGIWCEQTIGRINIFDQSPDPAPDAIDDIEMWTEGFKACSDSVLTNQPWHIQFGVQNKGEKPVHDWSYYIDLRNQGTGTVIPLKTQVPGPPLEVGEAMVLNWPSEHIFGIEDKGFWEIVVRSVVKDPGNPDSNPANDMVTVKFEVKNETPTATLLSLFQARPVSDGLELRWQFGDPDRVVDAVLDRAEAATGPWAALEAERRIDGSVAVALDRDVAPGRTYWYRLVATMRDGQVAFFGPLSATAGAPLAAFGLARLAPNPSQGPTRVEFTVPRESRVRLSILDLQGRELAVLAEGAHPPGRYQATWSGRTDRGDVPPGLYFVRFQTPEGATVGRLAVTR